MTIRSKQWYTKASRLANSLAKVSIGRLRLFLLQQQDHRPDDRWKSKRSREGRGKKGFQGKKPQVAFPCSAHESAPPRKVQPNLEPLLVSKFQISLGRLRPLTTAF